MYVIFIDYFLTGISNGVGGSSHNSANFQQTIRICPQGAFWESVITF